MDAFSEFIQLYSKQFDYYQELARVGNAKLESELAKRGIKAIVTHRAKRPESLRDKLRKLIEKNPNQTGKEMFDEIEDLAGVRVAIYFPSERDLVDEVIHEIFEVRTRNEYPESSYKPKYTKRFSGYWATHYKVCFKDDEDINKRFLDTVFEIQVASVLMHAWAEVEHDLVYKSVSDDISEEELAILDEINGLVMSGEIALERLHKAMSKRTKESKEIGGRYELTNFIINSLNRSYLDKLKLGDTKILRNFFKTMGKIDVDSFVEFLKKINRNVNRSISDQLIDMIILDYYDEDIREKSLSEFYLKIFGVNRDISKIESFFKAWVVLERCIYQLDAENNIRHKKYFIPKFDILQKSGKFYEDEIQSLHKFQSIRSWILHGEDTPTDNYLNDVVVTVKQLTTKAIHLIQNSTVREKLITDLYDI